MATSIYGEPTAKQAAVHRFMMDHQQSQGRPPTFREIMDEFGFKSPTAVWCHLRALTKKGRIRLTGGSTTSRRFLAVDPDKPNACPCCGRDVTD